MAWVVLLVVAVPILGVVAWLLLDESIVRIPSGSLGLLLVHGRATERVLGPGRHLVPSFRQHTVQQYPALELAYRADGGVGTEAGPSAGLERTGPLIVAVLGDRTTVSIACSLRCRLISDRLRDLHDSVGPDGLWGSIRDLLEHEVRDSLLEPGVTVDSFFGSERRQLVAAVSFRLRSTLELHGLALVSFSLADVDLGAAGAVIAATSRARLELEREKAEARVRRQRVTNDAQLADAWGQRNADIALRHRELDTWREVLARSAPSVQHPGSAHLPQLPASRPNENATAGRDGRPPTMSAPPTVVDPSTPEDVGRP